MYSDDEGILVDNVLKYEELSQEVERLMERIGVNIPCDLPELKSNAKHIDVFSVLDDNVKNEAAKVFL
ncbi:hypothetical protein EKG36_20360 [Halomonas nitroreducens]|uniref:Uncharacterized protein n=1 Tax=Halomonas nitroreducens TaxID=447425 RepID=A0A3S0JSZ2_9GAMM|nr:hypothetical protein EKG36_20360 [Halomonas nitroreducens]